MVSQAVIIPGMETFQVHYTLKGQRHTLLVQAKDYDGASRAFKAQAGLKRLPAGTWIERVQA